MTESNFQNKLLVKAFRISLLLRFVPFIRLIAVNGSVAKKRANKNSDIDFWLVTKKDRLWLCRAFILSLTQFLLLRVDYKNRKIAGRACFNCFQTEDNLQVSPQNKKVAQDYSRLYVLWYTDNLLVRYRFANRWFLKFGQKFNLEIRKRKLFDRISDFFPLIWRFVFELILELIFSDWLEKKVAVFQKNKIKKNFQKNHWPTKRLYLTNKEIRTHW